MFEHLRTGVLYQVVKLSLMGNSKNHVIELSMMENMYIHVCSVYQACQANCIDYLMWHCAPSSVVLFMAFFLIYMFLIKEEHL